ncbi:MAG TPA: hypothetical protein VK557_09115 [Pyrinomonadaceae bacterium]|nr:hypothetical protein [Pyrinomonadaceae bacterium]
MWNLSGSARFILSIVLIVPGSFAFGQQPAASEFGPVVTAYLGYLSNEQEVVDDRASRREITAAYYRRNSNRIHALRQMAIRLARESGNDYIPELEAVTVDEFGTIFEHPPHPAALRPSEVFGNKFRFLGSVHSGESFYLFARLDPYEQAELIQRSSKAAPSIGGTSNGQNMSETSTRARRVVPK